MQSTAPSKFAKLEAPPLVLIVDDEPHLREVITDVIHGGMDCRILTASTLAEAREILHTQTIQLLVADVNLPDGDGTSLLPILQRHQPTASAVVITGAPTLAGAISAMREGAVDFVPKPFTNEQLFKSLRSALNQTALADKQERRFTRLKAAVKRLNESRRMISRKVDLLCNDLVTAYGDLSRQLDDVRTQEGFRKFIANAADLEQLLCHAMDWMLRQLGYCNVAVYLAGDDGEFQLGAYMKYTLAGDAPLTDALKRVMLPAVNRDGVFHASADTFEKQLSPSELQLVKGHDVLGVNCTYLADSLATLIFFREAKSPFSEEDKRLVESISAIFAISLATVVRESSGGEEEGGDTAFEDGPPDKDNKRRRKDPADWWKNGDDAPF